MVSHDWIQLTPMAPSTAPIRVPRPPAATHTTISMEGSTPILAGVMIPTWGA